MDNQLAAVKKACAAAGNASILARKLGIAVQSIQQWKKIPAERVLSVEEATGLSRHELRSDLYPLEREQQ